MSDRTGESPHTLQTTLPSPLGQARGASPLFQADSKATPLALAAPGARVSSGSRTRAADATRRTSRSSASVGDDGGVDMSLLGGVNMSGSRRISRSVASANASTDSLHSVSKSQAYQRMVDHRAAALKAAQLAGAGDDDDDGDRAQ